MMKKTLLLIIMILMSFNVAKAQRPMDKLDRGLVAVKVSGGVFCSWRIPGEEWYDVKYNLYRDGTKVNSTPLNVSNYTDAVGTLSSKYTVKAVVKGVEQEACAPASVLANQYVQFPVKSVYCPMVGDKQTDVTSKYILDEASVGDLDGDGKYEIIVGRLHRDFTVANDTMSSRFEAYKTDGTKMWQIDVGKNVINEVNPIVYDWDMDGKAEVIMRCADGTILNDGTVIGDPVKSYRSCISQATNEWFMTQGPEYLILLDGTTGKLLDKIDFPLPRGNAADWGDTYGHRCNKFFYGAPYLDGRHPSLVMCRGIYTKTIMCALDIVNKKFQKRWENLTDFTKEGSPWYGQGYHNFGIADCDDDGKDEIVYGSMLVDDNGKGLNTTGLGHGDAQHCGDLDPYHKGLEIFACNEASPGANFREAATGKILWRYTSASDCGRCMAANVTNDFDGCVLIAGPHFHMATANRDTAWKASVTMNFELYWDGDLLQETFDYTNISDVLRKSYGTPAIYKSGAKSPIFTMDDCATIAYTKGNPLMQCDILGDWREEEILPTADNKYVRIYTTTAPTENRVYTLLHDMQYRNAIVWQPCGYNQPPHESFYLGEREGILTPPPPVMTNGRTEETTAITAKDNNQHVTLCNMYGGNVAVSEGVQPYIVTVNSPKDYTLTGAAFTNDMRLVKQGCGNLSIGGNQTYTGETNVWDGTLTVNGTIQNSKVWLNRFAEINLHGTVAKSQTEEYGAILHIDGDNAFGKSTIDTLNLKRGAVVKFDLRCDNTSFDKNDTLVISGKLNLTDGCVFKFTQHNAAGANRPAAGEYFIGTYKEVSSNTDKISVEGLGGTGATLIFRDNKIYVNVPATRKTGNITWNGSNSNVWDIIKTANFDNDGSEDIFNPGDNVTFDDNAQNFDVNIGEALAPKSITFNNTKDYTLSGDSIIGTTGLTKNGVGKLTINNVNGYTGNTIINGGTIAVKTLSNAVDINNSALGRFGNQLYINNGACLEADADISMGGNINIGDGGATINVTSGKNFTMTKTGAVLAGGAEDVVKTGAGQLTLFKNNTIRNLYINEGTVSDGKCHTVGDTVIFNGPSTTLIDENTNQYYHADKTNFIVPEGNIGSFYLDGRCDYYGKLFGAGTFNVHALYVRNYLFGDWSAFTGTVNAYMSSEGLFDFKNAYGLPNATLNVESGCIVSNNGKDFKLGALTGSGKINGDGTYIIGSRNEDFKFDGTIYLSNVTKVGSGIWTVSKNQESIGKINVNEGTLSLNNAMGTSTLTGYADLTLAGTGVLAGKGYCANNNIYVTSGGTIRPGMPASKVPSGTISIKGKLTVAKGGNADFFASSASNTGFSRTYLTIGKLLTINGNVNLKLADAYEPAAGDSIILWNAGSFAGTPTFNLPELPKGLSWDTSSLLAPKGVLRVALTNGISSIDNNEMTSCEVFTLSGVKVAEFKCRADEIHSTLNNSPIINGTYVLMVKGNKICFKRKFVKGR